MRFKTILLTLTAISMIGGITLVSGCEKKEPETPGQALDRAIQNTGEAMQEAGEKVEDAAE
jgi:hypothetical protein